jgi:putative two-component system response regulator
MFHSEQLFRVRGRVANVSILVLVSAHDSGGLTERPTIVVVEDDRSVRELLDEQLTQLGYRVVTAASAEAALGIVDEAKPDLILSDVHMGRMNGIQLCAHLKRDRGFELTPVVLLTAEADLESRIAGLEAGADDFFAKPFDHLELRTRLKVLLQAKRLVDQLERAESVITTLGMTIEARDPYTAGHCQRLASQAVALGQALGVDAAGLRALRLAGFLHDLGKVAVPDRILLKPGPLTPEERERMRNHPVVSEDLVRGLRTLDEVRPIIRHHHERMDGSGYPDGLTGTDIPAGARIMAVVDVYDALRSRRPYKQALDHDDALTILRREADAGFWDPRATKTFIEMSDDLVNQ